MRSSDFELLQFSHWRHGEEHNCWLCICWSCSAPHPMVLGSPLYRFIVAKFVWLRMGCQKNPVKDNVQVNIHVADCRPCNFVLTNTLWPTFPDLPLHCLHCVPLLCALFIQCGISMEKIWIVGRGMHHKNLTFCVVSVAAKIETWLCCCLLLDTIELDGRVMHNKQSHILCCICFGINRKKNYAVLHYWTLLNWTVVSSTCLYTGEAPRAYSTQEVAEQILENVKAALK